MKILEVVRSYYPVIGGLENYVNDRLKLYKILGYDYDLITTDYLAGRQPKISEAYIRLKQYTKYNIVFEQKRLRQIIQTKYDIISINQIGNYLSDYLLFKKFAHSTKKILTPHFYFHTKAANFFKKFHSKAVTPKLLSEADTIICFTNCEAEYWKNKFNIADEKIEIIPHYFEIDSVERKPQDDSFILYIARKATNKRLDLLLEAWNDKNISLNLYVVGSDSKAIENSKIKYFGTVEEDKKREMLNKCTAVILASNHEAFGRVLLEACAYKKPVICSALNVFKEIMSNKGVIYFDNNVTDIKRAVEHFQNLTNSERESMGLANYEKLKSYSRERALKAFRNLYESIL